MAKKTSLKQMLKIKRFLFKNWVIIIILLLAAFLRLYRIADYMTFLGDEGRDVLIVYEILHGKLTLLGPTASVGGFFLGPIYYYFMTPFLWLFNYNPVGPAIMVAFFGVATVWLIYKIATMFFNQKVGLISSFLYAISPVVIAYSRSSWNPNIVPFFSLLSLFFAYKALNKKSLKWFLMCGIFLGIGLQLHYLILFLITIILVYVLISEFILNKKENFLKKVLGIIKNYLFILIGIIIGWIPFLAFEIRHGFQNIQSIFNFVLKSGDTGGNPQFFNSVYDVFFRIYARLVFSYPPIERLENYTKLTISAWQALVIIVSLLSIVLLFYLLFKNLKNKDKFLQFNLLLVWLVVGVLLFGFYKKSIYDYYFGFLFPLPFLLIGNFIYEFYLRSKSLIKIIPILLLFFIVFLNLNGIPFKHQPNRQLNQMETIAKFVVDKANNKPFNFALITGGNSDHAYRYFFKVWDEESVIIKDLEKDPERETVTDQLFIVCESIPCYPLGHSLWEVAGFGRAEIENEWDVSVVKVYKLIPHKEE